MTAPRARRYWRKNPSLRPSPSSAKATGISTFSSGEYRLPPVLAVLELLARRLPLFTLASVRQVERDTEREPAAVAALLADGLQRILHLLEKVVDLEAVLRLPPPFHAVTELEVPLQAGVRIPCLDELRAVRCGVT